jgi:surfeit locus 1 family protein
MRSRWRALLGAVVILGLCGMCVRLGFWQLGRLEQRRARNAVALRGLSLPPVRLDSGAVAALLRDPPGWSYRRATVRGSYEPAREIILRGRSDGGQPGVHLVTPLRLEGSGRVLLVNRGWVPAPDGLRPAERPAPPPGSVEATGLLMEIPRTGDGGAPLTASAGETTYRRLDLEAARGRNGPAVLPLYLQLTPGGDAARLPRAVPAPELGEGPHLSYAIQWFGFAATGVIGLLILLLRGRGPASGAPPPVRNLHR